MTTELITFVLKGYYEISSTYSCRRWLPIFHVLFPIEAEVIFIVSSVGGYGVWINREIKPNKISSSIIENITQAAIGKHVGFFGRSMPCGDLKTFVKLSFPARNSSINISCTFTSVEIVHCCRKRMKKASQTDPMRTHYEWETFYDFGDGGLPLDIRK